MLLYVSQQCASDPEFGSTLLNKILFFADFIAYGKLGEPITSAVYVRDKRGPVPRDIEEYRKELRDDGRCDASTRSLRV